MAKSGYNTGERAVGDAEDRRQTRLTRWEMETTVNYNAEENKAVLYTRDKSVMRKLDKLVAEFPETYKLVRETDIDKTYEFPKRMLSFRKPRVLTDEQRAEMRDRLAKARAGQEDDIDGVDEAYEEDE